MSGGRATRAAVASGAAPTGGPVVARDDDLRGRPEPLDWAAANQLDLMRAVTRVRGYLETALGGDPPQFDPGAEGDDPPVTAAERTFAPYAIERIVAAFGLSTFERDLLILCAGVELSAEFADAVARCRQDGEGRAVATFGLGLAVLPNAHWSALAPDAPLRRWRLLDAASPGLTDSPQRVDERVLHFLAGVGTLDDRLAPYVRGGRDAAERAVERPAASDRDAALAASIAARLAEGGAPLQLAGGDAERRIATARAAAAFRGGRLLLVRAGDLPDSPGERLVLATLLARESLLEGDVVAIDATEAGPLDDARLAAFLEALPVPALVVTSDPIPGLAGRAPVVALAPASGADRLERWRAALGADRADGLNGTVEALAAAFDVIPAAVAGSLATAASGPDDVWDAARVAARPRMEGLAERIEPAAGWDDLVLPADRVAALRGIALHVRRRHRVHEEWGFARKGSRGLGIAALFAGPSGTGKTMAAEVLARDLRLDLYRIDLASVVSKYIGETEKNLSRVFRAAEGSGAILLFDEADALFGRRSEVRDSHDRYANVEIAYLLQRMETYRGLAILTTNAKDALDPAFLRRLRFVVTFPFPDALSRTQIWRVIFPAETPTDGLVPERLGQLNASGGQIRNIALGAAFLAADAGERVSMRHLAAAARAEYAKQERQPGDAELRGWT